MASSSAAFPSGDTAPATSRGQDSTLYFGFGSNMWLYQMKRRCPDSPYVGVAILEGWKWIINQRGYANVVPSDGDVVYGLVFELSKVDEDTLDRCESVPHAYTKEIHQIQLFKKGIGLPGEGRRGEATNGLVYVDVERVLESDPKGEYIDRMNMAIKDALDEGVPSWYVDKYIRKSISKRPSLNSYPPDIFLNELEREPGQDEARQDVITSLPDKSIGGRKADQAIT